MCVPLQTTQQTEMEIVFHFQTQKNSDSSSESTSSAGPSLCIATTEWFNTGTAQIANYPNSFHPVPISQQQIGLQHLFMGH